MNLCLSSTWITAFGLFNSSTPKKKSFPDDIKNQNGSHSNKNIVLSEEEIPLITNRSFYSTANISNMTNITDMTETSQQNKVITRSQSHDDNINYLSNQIEQKQTNCDRCLKLENTIEMLVKKINKYELMLQISPVVIEWFDGLKNYAEDYNQYDLNEKKQCFLDNPAIVVIEDEMDKSG